MRPARAAGGLAAWLPGLALVAGVAAAQGPDWPTYRSDRFGFEFRHPPGFVVGSFRWEIPPTLSAEAAAALRATGSPWAHAIVLVEPARLGGRDPQRLPPGEIATIVGHPTSGPDAQTALRLSGMIYKEAEQAVTLGGHRVLKFPGMPGPHGTEAF